MPLRLLARAAPLVLGALAAAIWLRREPGRLALPAAPKPPSNRFVRASETPAVDIVMVVDDLLTAQR